MSARIWYVTAVLTAAGTQLFGQLGDPTQAGPHIFGSGYTLPTPVNIAPGQLLTLIIDGTTLSVGPGVTIHAPAGADLPTTLAGISLSYFQGGTKPLPILTVRAFYGRYVSIGNIVYGRGEAVPLGAVTVQIPFETVPAPSGGQVLASFQDGTAPLGVDTNSFADQVHILTSCDTIASDNTMATVSPAGLPCPSVVTHADGSPVSVKNPAQGGEEIVAWAVGLGQTNPPLQTGKLVTAAVLTQTTFGLDFNYKPNALASKPLPNAPAPVFAGATPGYVGLYQINFVVPPPPAGTPPCVEPSQPGQNVVYSNLTVSVGGQSSFDGARICVAVPNS